jgi:hypothetical protein
VGDYTLKCHLAVKEGGARHCNYAVGTNGCLKGHVVCMMAYGVKDGEVIFDNFAYHQQHVRHLKT